MLKSCQARNILLFTLLIDDASHVNAAHLWSIYYHLYLDDESLDILWKQAKKLYLLSVSLKIWKSSEYGRLLRFCDEKSLSKVSGIWYFWATANAIERQRKLNLKRFEKGIESSIQFKSGLLGPNFMATYLQSAAPMISESLENLATLHEEFWETGTYYPARRALRKPPHPNLTFMSFMTDRSTIHYETDPLLGFHLAPAYAPLSPEFCEHYLGRPQCSNHRRAIEEARFQFQAWGASFRQSCRQNKPLVLRFYAGDALAFCHVLQRNPENGNLTVANLVRDRQGLEPLILDKGEYGPTDGAPLSFSVIDTSNLVDCLGGLSILAAAGPLLDESLSSTLYTETILRQNKDPETMAEDLFCGHLPIISHLLGLFPIEYWTNVKNTSELDKASIEAYMNSKADKGSYSESYNRTAWKRPMTSLAEVPKKNPAPAIRFDSNEFSHFLYQIYLDMFHHENMSLQTVQKSSPPKYHAGSFVVFICAISHRVVVPWPETIATFFQLVSKNPALMVGTDFVQELYVQLHISGYYSAPSLETFPESLRQNPIYEASRLRVTKNPVAWLTLVVPRANFDLFTTKIPPLKHDSFPVHVVMQSATSSDKAWSYSFAAVQLAFGEVTKSDFRESDVHRFRFVTDEQGWMGKSSMLVSFWAPSRLVFVELQPVRVAFRIQSTPQTASSLLETFGTNLTVFETDLWDTANTFGCDSLPFADVYPSICKSFIKAAIPDKHNNKTGYVTTAAKIHKDTAQIKSLTYGLHFGSDKENLISLVGGLVETVQVSPSVISLYIARVLHRYRLDFSVPVIGSRSFRSINQESLCMEVTAPVASPLDQDVFPGFIYPLFLNGSNPIVWNLPYIHLKNLPKLEFSSHGEMTWLFRHACCMFKDSDPENIFDDIKDALEGEDAFFGFKSSLINIFILAADAIEGDKDDIFVLTNRDRLQVDTYIFVSCLRLDAPNQTALLDVAILPGTIPILVHEKNLLDALTKIKAVRIPASDGTINIWKTVMPAFVERCREWEHQSSCEYLTVSKVPLPTSYGTSPVCSCGEGKLPPHFMQNLPGWKAISKYVTRAAISFAFPVPGVKHVFGDYVSSSTDQPGASCHRCGTPRSQLTWNLLKCARCHAVCYCSTDCQHRDWKKHKEHCVPRKLCGRCGKSEEALGRLLLMCANCRKAFYCTSECQVQDWTGHQMKCAREGEYGKRFKQKRLQRQQEEMHKKQSGDEEKHGKQSEDEGEHGEQSDSKTQLDKPKGEKTKPKEKNWQETALEKQSVNKPQLVEQTAKTAASETQKDRNSDPDTHSNKENEPQKNSGEETEPPKSNGKEPEPKKNGGKEIRRKKKKGKEYKHLRWYGNSG